MCYNSTGFLRANQIIVMEGKPAFETCYFLPKTVRVATESKVNAKKK